MSILNVMQEGKLYLAINITMEMKYRIIQKTLVSTIRH